METEEKCIGTLMKKEYMSARRTIIYLYHLTLFQKSYLNKGSKYLQNK